MLDCLLLSACPSLAPMARSSTLILLALVAVCAVFASAARTPREYREAFTNWMHEHNKAYDAEEFHLRFKIFRDNLDFIDSFDGDFEVGLNEFSDLSNAEFVARFNGYKPSAEQPDESDVDTTVAPDANPTAVDWRTKGWVTPVKNQGTVCTLLKETEPANAIKQAPLVHPRTTYIL